MLYEVITDRALLFFPQHSDAVAQGGEVGITAHINRMLRTSLHAGVALPAEIGLDVVSTTIGAVDVHDVRGTNINALSAAVAANHVYECRHVIPSPPLDETDDPKSQTKSSTSQSIRYSG